MKKLVFNKKSGISFTEMMLALSLSSIIFACLGTVYLATHKNDQLKSALLSIQENSQMAVQLFHSMIRTAGYIGCANLTNDFPLTTFQSFDISKDNRIHSYHGEIKPETDAITIRRLEINHASLTENMSSFNVLYLTRGSAISQGNILLISDCKTAEIFKVALVSKIHSHLQRIVSTEPLKKRYDKFAYVGHLEINTYFIGKTERTHTNGTPIYALYVKNIHSRKEELIEGITNMKIKYTILENQSLQEKKSNEIRDWSRVIGVSISLEFQSLNSIFLQKKIYTHVSLRSK